MVIRICVGSSCHLKGSNEIVRLMQEAIAKHGLENDVTLAGSFCTGKCNRVGVTVSVDDNVFPGFTPVNFNDFFKSKVLG